MLLLVQFIVLLSITQCSMNVGFHFSKLPGLSSINKNLIKTVINSHYSSRTSSHVLMADTSSSVSPEPKPSRPQKAFIISPSTQPGGDELLILQNFNQIQGSDRKKIGIIGTSQLSDNHGQMIELLSYALILSGNHVYTSGGEKGTNIAVIRGALRACNPDLLTVILPQSLFLQPLEMQPLLLRVANLIEQPDNDNLDIKSAALQCNEDILSRVDKVLVFAYHESKTILKAVDQASDHLDVILFYLD